MKHKNNISHKPNEIRTIKAKNYILLAVGRRTRDCGGGANRGWRKTQLYCMNYSLIMLLILFLTLLWHPISMIIFLAIFVTWSLSLSLFLSLSLCVEILSLFESLSLRWKYFLFFNFWYVVENWFVVIVECVWWKQWVVKSGVYVCGGRLG